MSSVAHLFRPFTLNRLALPNRIVMAPMTRNMAPHQVPDDKVAAYYRVRAEAEVGLIITEGTVVDPSASNRVGIPSFFGEAALDGWAKVVREVKAAGGKIFPQLWHLGVHRGLRTGPYPDEPTFSPSGIALNGDVICEPMTSKDIDRIIQAFATAAVEAKRIGFDGIELHGAHGYMLDQFFWERTNIRSDPYGGSVEARTRFPVEIIKAVRAATGPDFPICYRFSQWKILNYEARLATNPRELERYVRPLVDAGADILHASQRRFWLPEFPEEHPRLNLAGWAKKITGLPSITVGSVTLGRLLDAYPPEASDTDNSKTDVLLEMLDAGDFDLVAVGRALIANPDWATKMRRGHFKSLKAFEPGMLDRLD